MPQDTQLVALDWGTTSLRAYRIGPDGAVLDTRAAPLGILKVPDGDFDGTFDQIAGPWLDASPTAPVIACGMIGSRQGWVEAPYVPCPAGVADLAARLTPHDTRRGRTVWFVPGVNRFDADGVGDVIRGEETQIVGAGGSGVFLLPGTHSKWVWVEDGRLTWFATFMTGEVFAVLRDHSILGRLMSGDAHDGEAFRRGLDYAWREGPAAGGLLKRLFSARTLGLFGHMAAPALPAYLSGLLIGSEIDEACGCIAAASGTPPQRITVVGGVALAARYEEALVARGLAAERRGEETTTAGLARIARAAGLVAAMGGG